MYIEHFVKGNVHVLTGTRVDGRVRALMGEYVL